jgi:hypothetical protein
MRVEGSATLEFQVPDQHRREIPVLVARSCQEGPAVVVRLAFEPTHSPLKATVRLVERFGLHSGALQISPGECDAYPIPLMLRSTGQRYIGQKEESSIGAERFCDDPSLVT